jgi:hypothetical protein
VSEGTVWFLTHRRTHLLAAALVCFALAAVLSLVAVDASRSGDALTKGDVRYQLTPEAEELWAPSELAPLGLTGKALGTQDDLDYRRAVRALRLARLEDGTISDPALALKRNEAQAGLEAIASGSGDRIRRSRAAGLLGVLGIARLASETQDRGAILESTVANLRRAIDLDPDNADAKFNLELALQRGRGIQITEGAGGTNFSPGGAGASGAGAGDAGSGY